MTTLLLSTIIIILVIILIGEIFLVFLIAMIDGKMEDIKKTAEEAKYAKK